MIIQSSIYQVNFHSIQSSINTGAGHILKPKLVYKTRNYYHFNEMKYYYNFFLYKMERFPV